MPNSGQRPLRPKFSNDGQAHQLGAASGSFLNRLQATGERRLRIEFHEGEIEGQMNSNSSKSPVQTATVIPRQTRPKQTSGRHLMKPASCMTSPRPKVVLRRSQVNFIGKQQPAGPTAPQLQQKKERLMENKQNGINETEFALPISSPRRNLRLVLDLKPLSPSSSNRKPETRHGREQHQRGGQELEFLPSLPQSPVSNQNRKQYGGALDAPSAPSTATATSPKSQRSPKQVPSRKKKSMPHHRAHFKMEEASVDTAFQVPEEKQLRLFSTDFKRNKGQKNLRKPPQVKASLEILNGEVSSGEVTTTLSPNSFFTKDSHRFGPPSSQEFMRCKIEQLKKKLSSLQPQLEPISPKGHHKRYAEPLMPMTPGAEEPCRRSLQFHSFSPRSSLMGETAASFFRKVGDSQAVEKPGAPLFDYWKAAEMNSAKQQARDVMMKLNRKIEKLTREKSRARKQFLVDKYRTEFGSKSPPVSYRTLVSLKPRTVACSQSLGLELLLEKKARALARKNAALKIQRWFRRQQGKKALEGKIGKLSNAIISIKRMSRAFQQRTSINKANALKQERAACLIQSCLRGFQARQSCLKPLLELRTSEIHAHFSVVDRLMKCRLQRMVRRAWLSYKQKRCPQREKVIMNYKRRGTECKSGPRPAFKFSSIQQKRQPSERLLNLGGQIQPMKPKMQVRFAVEEADELESSKASEESLLGSFLS